MLVYRLVVLSRSTKTGLMLWTLGKREWRLTCESRQRNTEVSRCGEIVFDGGERRPEEAGLGHIIEADHGDVEGNVNVVLFKGANGAEGHLIIGDDHGGELTPMTGHEGRSRGEARRGGEIAIGMGTRRVTRLLQCGEPTLVATASNQVVLWTSDTGDGRVALSDQMIGGHFGGVFLIDEDRTGFPAEVGIEADGRDIPEGVPESPKVRLDLKSKMPATRWAHRSFTARRISSRLSS